MSNAILEKPMNIDEAADFLNYKKSYIYQLVSKKKIPCYKPTGGYLYFKQKDLEDFIFRGKISADYEIKENVEKILNKKK